MKKIFFIAMLFLSGILFAQKGTIEVSVKGINPKKGKEIRIGVYNKTGFLKKMFIQKIIVSKGTEVTILLNNVEIGKYAIVVFQDENSDGKMNTSFMGKPKELNGFSNDAKGNFGPPEFKNAVFNVIENKVINLIIHLEK